MTQDIITVIIPTYNRATLLKRALESVLQEKRIPIHVHVFDNASTDETPHMLADLSAQESRITYHRNEKNIGVSENYKLALGSISTKYFVPLADDDFVLENFLYDAYNIMQSQSNLGAVIFIGAEVDNAGNLRTLFPSNPQAFPEGRLTPAENLRPWLEHHHYHWSAILWSKDVLKTIGPPYLHTGMPSDVDFQAQAFCVHDVFIVKRCGAIYSAHPDQQSRTMTLSDMESWTRLFERLDRQVLKHNIFELNEYAGLRQKMWNRYRPLWHSSPRTAVTPSQIAQWAFIAGFRLGDWPLAFQLAQNSTINPPSTASLLSLPDPKGSDMPILIAGGRQALAMQAIQWFKHMLLTHKTLELELKARTEQLAAAEQRANTAEAQLLALQTQLSGAAPNTPSPT